MGTTYWTTDAAGDWAMRRTCSRAGSQLNGSTTGDIETTGAADWFKAEPEAIRGMSVPVAERCRRQTERGAAQSICGKARSPFEEYWFR